MRRADRLFEILQVLRRARGPLTASAIAEQLETSQRTIYRDLAALMARRVPIKGEAGVGYVLEKGFDLPPLMLTPAELESVVLGAQWVAAHADEQLAAAAMDVVAKISAIVPKSLREFIDDPVVGTPPAKVRQAASVDVSRLREWTRKERKLALRYVDEGGTETERVVWPFLIGYVAGVRAVLAWCELRRGFRVFRIERLRAVTFLDEPYPERRGVLRRRWDAEHAHRKVRRASTSGRSSTGS